MDLILPRLLGKDLTQLEHHDGDEQRPLVSEEDSRQVHGAALEAPVTAERRRSSANAPSRSAPSEPVQLPKLAARPLRDRVGV